MGRVAERQSDQVVITSDNPRSEDPGHILEDILAGTARPERVVVIEDRSTAIAWTVARAATDDVVLVAGKGHETRQDIGGRQIAMSDYAIARKALAARGGAR